MFGGVSRIRELFLIAVGRTKRISIILVVPAAEEIQGFFNILRAPLVKDLLGLNPSYVNRRFLYLLALQSD